MEIQKRKLVLRVVFDLICLALMGIPVIILFTVGKGYRRGFYCDDQSLMHPHLPNTIPTWVAGFVGILLPSLAILICEGIKSYREKRKFLPYVALVYQSLMPFLFGVAVTQLTTDIAKYSIGRLRPHFITICKPDPTVCNTNTGYIIEDICTGTDTDALHEARLSFPSGHSSVSFYTMVWLIVYLQYKFTWKRVWLVRPVLQSVAFFLAYYTALSRVSDYMHHWSDVLSGAIIGTVLALCDIFFMSNILPWRKNSLSDCSTGTLPLYNSPAVKETACDSP